MKKILNSLLLLTLPFFYCAAQTDSINQRIFLIGDAGELRGETHPVVDWLKKHVDWNDDKNTVIYLGDNVYPLGMPTEGESSYKEAKRILDYQMSLVKGTKSKAFFVPGNHDWKNGKLGGWQQVINQVDYINGQQQANIQAWPLDGCPGPVEVELNDKIVVVLMDSQWFLYLHEKPGPGSNCQAKTIDEFATELREIAASHPNQLLVLAMHHPIYSYGVHGGDYSWRSHLFPFTDVIPWLYFPMPIIGSIYPIARGVFGNIQDVQHPLYKNMARTIEEVLKEHPNTIVAAGHDHSLQFIRNKKDSIPFIVSGSGSNLSRVKKGSRAEFEDLNYGFSMIEVRKSGKVEIKYYNITSADLTTPTFVAASKPIIIKEEKAKLDTLRPLKDSVTIVANKKLKGNAIKRMLMGRNYRKEWTTPVTVPVLDLGKEFGGLKPKREGGGKQTKSLRVEDSSGKEWVLRSIEKFPEAAIPADLRGGLANDIVADGISASYPFASLSIAPIAEAAGIPVIRRKLVYVPDDPRLQRFRNDFHDRLAILEEREPEWVKKTYNTDELVLRLAKDNDDHVDQKELLKARLMDNFNMDLDRHEDQWRWATRDTGKGKIYYAIPRDHDQSFYLRQGLLPHLASKPWLIPELQGFRPKAINIKTFNRPARNFDRAFLNELDEDDWRKAVDTFLNAMTDDVIEEALHRQPREIQGFAMNNIIATLKERRKYFMSDMMEYYRFISKVVSITGTNKKELFTVTKNNDGSIHVVVNKLEKDDVVSSKIYDRVFYPAVTKELRLYGLGNDDKFVIEGGNSPIKVRIIGGPGKDEYNNKGKGGHVKIYDAAFEQDTIMGNPGLQNRISKDPQVNRYDRLGYKYNYIHPALSAAYNVDDGVYLGGRVEIFKQGFRKEPFASRQLIVANRALKTSSYFFKYEGDFTKLVGQNDLLLRLDAWAPINVTNFFGIGNTTTYDKNQPQGVRYYRANYDVVNGSVLLRKQLQSWMKVNYGPTYQYYKLKKNRNEGHYISQSLNTGLDSSILYNAKSFAGAQVVLDINSKNDLVIPSRGLVMNVNAKQLFGLNGSSHTLTKANIDLSLFMSLASRKRYVLATRLGAGHIIGKFDVPQANYLSGTDNLRGFRKYRFSGRTMFYNNTEMRFKITDFTTYFFPGSFGILLFNDVGRVWADKESSRIWHDGYGGGIWLSPVHRFVLTATVAHSVEEKLLPAVTFGFQF